MKKRNRMISAAFLLPFAFIMMTSFKGHRSMNYSHPEGWELESLQLQDGVYQGEATGFREGLIVEVTVNEGSLTNVSVVDHHEIGPQYYKRPISLIPERIVEEQSTSVDSVTGATATSMAIMSAVENALLQAEN